MGSTFPFSSNSMGSSLPFGSSTAFGSSAQTGQPFTFPSLAAASAGSTAVGNASTAAASSGPAPSGEVLSLMACSQHILCSFSHACGHVIVPLNVAPSLPAFCCMGHINKTGLTYQSRKSLLCYTMFAATYVLCIAGKQAPSTTPLGGLIPPAVPPPEAAPPAAPPTSSSPALPASLQSTASAAASSAPASAGSGASPASSQVTSAPLPGVPAFGQPAAAAAAAGMSAASGASAGFGQTATAAATAGAPGEQDYCAQSDADKRCQQQTYLLLLAKCYT